MCCEVPVDVKAEAAVGFPSGWRFYFGEDPTFSGSNYTHEPVPGLFILSDGNKKFRSVKAAASIFGSCLANETEIARQFYTHVGLPGLVPRTVRSPKSAMCGSSLSKYRVVGSRVCHMEGSQGRWGVITEKLDSDTKDYTFSVSRGESNYSIDLVSSRNFSRMFMTGAIRRRQFFAAGS